MQLTKEQVLRELRKHDLLGTGRVIFKVLDYSNNRLAPSKVAYRLSYVRYDGTRQRVTYYPDSVGFQWG